MTRPWFLVLLLTVWGCADGGRGDRLVVTGSSTVAPPTAPVPPKTTKRIGRSPPPGRRRVARRCSRDSNS